MLNDFTASFVSFQRQSPCGEGVGCIQGTKSSLASGAAPSIALQSMDSARIPTRNRARGRMRDVDNILSGMN